MAYMPFTGWAQSGDYLTTSIGHVAGRSAWAISAQEVERLLCVLTRCRDRCPSYVRRGFHLRPLHLRPRWSTTGDDGETDGPDPSRAAILWRYSAQRRSAAHGDRDVYRGKWTQLASKLGSGERELHPEGGRIHSVLFTKSDTG